MSHPDPSFDPENEYPEDFEVEEIPFSKSVELFLEKIHEQINPDDFLNAYCL